MSPTLVPALTEVVSLVSVHSSICAVRRDGGVWCWGALVQGRETTLTRVAW